MTSAHLMVEEVSMSYPLARGGSLEALHEVTFSAKEGEFVSLIGPSGCGKTTMIKLLAGLLEPTSGRILEDGREIRGVAGDRGVVFQYYHLYPWLSVEENIAFGLTVRQAPAEPRKKITAHYLAVMGLNEFARAYPRELSGGMQQRVALARTLATNPKILLMDEPFTSLDVQTKRFMQDLLLQLWSHERRTVIFVTHDVEEAVFMSDVVYIMSSRPGTLRERVPIPLSRPRDLTTEFSQEFIAIKKYVQEVITKESLGLVNLDLEIYKNL